jgi:outer membrane translocation and assembly module TamA
MMKIKNFIPVFAFAVLVTTPSVMEAQVTTKSGETPLATAAAAAPALTLVREGERAMSQGSKNSLTIDIPKTDEWFTDNAMVGNIGGANTVDMYVKFSEASDLTNMALWIDLGGAYVGSKEFSDKYKAAEKILTDFSIVVQREQTRQQLEEQQDEARKMDKQQKRLEDKNVDLHKDIENYKKRITQAEADIQTNLKQQEEQKAKIEQQKKLVEDIQKKLNSLN